MNEDKKITKRLDVLIGLFLDLLGTKEDKLSDRDKIAKLYNRGFEVNEIATILGKKPVKISKQLYFVKRKEKKNG